MFSVRRVIVQIIAVDDDVAGREGLLSSEGFLGGNFLSDVFKTGGLAEFSSRIPKTPST